MNTAILEKIEKENFRKDEIPAFRIGDTIRVHVKIKEGDKERVQLYTGTVIARDGKGATKTFTVRRISYGEGVERVFPFHSPSLAKIEIEKSGRVRRSKLYYLRSKTGKKSRVEEKREQPAAAATTA
ncbi:MAG: 50S ribosomal protein L19 [Lentisphaerae bacterium GWF2_57_35]|nr:MAG: 50S ribosomal protein L19 [Lentisphaerae bacterium GWF2_57_35]